MANVNVPNFLQGNELFKVMEGSYYKHKEYTNKIDANGNISARDLMTFSTSLVWRGEIAKRLLVDVTAKFSECRASELRNVIDLAKQNLADAKNNTLGAHDALASKRSEVNTFRQVHRSDINDLAKLERDVKTAKIVEKAAGKKVVNAAALVTGGVESTFVAGPADIPEKLPAKNLTPESNKAKRPGRPKGSKNRKK